MMSDTALSTGTGGHACRLVPEAHDRHVGPSSGASESLPPGHPLRCLPFLVMVLAFSVFSCHVLVLVKTGVAERSVHSCVHLF